MAVPLSLISASIIVGIIAIRLPLHNQARKLSEQVAMYSDIIADIEQKLPNIIINASAKEISNTVMSLKTVFELL